MELFRREGSPYWQVDVTDVAGHRRRVSTKRKDKREAERVATALLKAAQSEDGGKPWTTIAAACFQYVESLERAHAPYAKGCRALAMKLCRSIGSQRWSLDGNRRLDTLRPMDMETLVRSRQVEGNSPQTIAHEIKLLRAATHYAASLGQRVPSAMIDGSVRNAWRMPTLTQKTRYLSWAEWEKVYAHLDPHKPLQFRSKKGKLSAPYVPQGAMFAARQDAQDLLVALTMCGGRWSEVAGLTWEHVDTITWAHATLYGSKGKRDRMVPIPAQFAAVLRRRYAESTTGLVFPSPNGSRRHGTCRAILRAMEACGLNDPQSVQEHGRATVHSLRHTFASWLLQSNKASLADVQDALGHTTMQMTRRYAHLAKGESVARLGAVLSEIGQ